jgi:uncharacterized protein YndB with AHSA1/START domain
MLGASPPPVALLPAGAFPAAHRIAAPRTMGPIHAETTIDAPRERVFELLSDLANRPAFCDHFQQEFRLARLVSKGVGAAARFRVEAPRMAIWMETVIEELDPPHRIYERGRGGRFDRIPIVTVWELSAGARATSTEARLTFWTEASNPLDRLRERLGARRWYGRQWRRSLGRLKELAEAGGPVEPVSVAGGSRLAT